MKESREEYKIKIKKEIEEKLNLDMTKIYSIEEVKEILNKHNMNGSIIKFIPTTPHTGESIIETLVYMDMKVTDAIHKVLGIYEDKLKCSYCGDYFIEDEMVQFTDIKGYPILCKECRRKSKLKLHYWDFKERIPEEKREQFAREELAYGIDYSDYIEKLNKKNIKLQKG